MKQFRLNAQIGIGALLALLAQTVPAQTTQDTTTRYQYDAQGNLKQIADPLGRITDMSYDALNRLAQQQQPAPAAGAPRPTIKYGYDGQDRLTSVTDPRNLVTTYSINGLGEQNAVFSPDTGTTSHTYDAAGNLKTSTDAKGQTTSYSYDALNRLTRIAHADGNSIDYTYDQGPNGLGRLTSIADPSGTTQYAYDQKGRVLSETRTLGGTAYVTGYTYDSAGHLMAIAYPSGRIVSHTRDAMGRISQINVTKGGVTQTIVSQVIYRPFGGVQSFVNGRGQTMTRSHDLDGRITSYPLRGQPQIISYDAASRITAIRDTANAANTTSYGYDNLDRLTQASGHSAGQSFSYDATGNRTSQLLGSGSHAYSYPPGSNRLAQVSSPGGIQSYTYDANGSLLGNGAHQFSYDARGRLISAHTVLGLVQYRINALGQRVQKITASNSVVYHYDNNGKLIGESTTNGAYPREYVYLNDLPVAVLSP